MHFEFQIRVSKLVIPESIHYGFRLSRDIFFQSAIPRCWVSLFLFAISGEGCCGTRRRRRIRKLARKQEERFIVPTWIQRAEEAAGLRSEGDNMVNAIKGILISCDIPMAQFIVNLNESMPNAHKFIVYMLDDTHIYVQPHVGEMLTKRLQEFRDQNTYEKPL
jgi:TFIIH basal transcription factor complex TTD-A subunit